MTNNSKGIPIACRLLATDQWLRTHVSPDWSIEDLKIHLLDLCLGKISPRAISHGSPVARSTGESSPSSRTVLFPKPSLAPLHVDTSPKPGPDTDTPPSSFPPTSPISSPISPALDFGHPRFTSARMVSSGRKQLKRVHSGNGPQTDQTENSDDDYLVGTVSRRPDWPIFASEPEYEYLSDNPSFENGLFDSPLDEQTSRPCDAHNSHSSSATTALSRLRTTGVRKSSSRVAFQSQPEPHPAANDALAPVLQLSHLDLLRETKKRASNWVLYSFSNSHSLEDHLTLSDYGLRPHEMIEIHRRGRYIVQSRQLYQQPYFDALVYHGHQKGRGEKKSTRALSVRSSSSSINIKAAMSMSSPSISRQPSLRTKFSGESFNELNDPSRAHNHSRFGAGTEDEIGVTVTKPETPSPPSAKGVSTPILNSAVRPASIGGTPRVLRSSPSVTFANQSKTLSLRWRLRWLVIHSGWLMVWKDRTSAKLVEEHDLSNLVSVKEVMEVPHESALPSHPVQHWKYIMGTFATSSESSQSQTPEGDQLFLNLPDNSCHENVFRILFRIARANYQYRTCDPRNTPVYGAHWSTWRERFMERATAAGRWERSLLEVRRESFEIGAAPYDDADDGSDSEREWEYWEGEYGGRDTVLSFEFNVPSMSAAPSEGGYSHGRDRSVTISASEAVDTGGHSPRSRTKSFTNALPSSIRAFGQKTSDGGLSSKRPRSSTVTAPFAFSGR